MLSVADLCSHPSGTSAMAMTASDKNPVVLSSLNLRSIFSTQPITMSQSSGLLPTCRPSSYIEWRKALVNVKNAYLERKYRSCATKCQELLAAAKSTRTAEVAQLVYLHFYAASSLEMQVRNLHPTSPHRMPILNAARDHYRRAAVLAEAEAGAALQAAPVRSGSSASSHSSVPSLSSGPSSRSSSPSLSTYDEQEMHQPRPVLKKVRFEISSELPRDPFCRPDSPTLGEDKRPNPYADPDHEAPDLSRGDLHLSPKAPLPLRIHRARAALKTLQLVDEPADDSVEPARHIRHDAASLVAVHRQITLVHLPALEQHQQAARSSTMSLLSPASHSAEMRAADLQARISRLRLSGWRRERFDATRYELIRVSAMVDVAAT